MTTRPHRGLAVAETLPTQDGPDLSETICWCFSITRGEIEAEWRSARRSLLRDRIRRETSAGHCSCARMNPKRSCCLADVDRLITDLEGSDCR